MKLKALIEKRNNLEQQAKEILDNVALEVRAITPDEKNSFEDLCSKIQQLNETIELFEKRQKEETVETVKIENREEENIMENVTTTLKEREIRGLDQFIRKQNGEELREMTTGANGEIIPTHLFDEVIEVLSEVAPIFNEVPKLTPVSGTLEILKEKTLGQAAFVGESSALTPEDFDFDKVKLEQRRAGAAVALTQKLVNDSGIDIVAYAKSVLYRRLGAALDDAMINGTVAGESFEGVYSLSGVEIETAAEDVTSIDDYINVLNNMHPTLQGDAKWIIAREEFNKLALLKDAVGNYYLNRDVINGKPAYRLLGCEIIISEGMDAETKPAILINVKEAYSGMIKKDMELKQISTDTTNALKGTSTLVLDMYADVRVVRPEAIKVLKIKTLA